MPHFIYEFSPNIEQGLKLPELFEKMHEVAIDTGVFPLGGIRSRAYKADYYRISDGDPTLGFIHLCIKVGAGRTEETLKAAADRLFDCLTEHLQELFDSQYLGISMEMMEIHPTITYKKNNIHQKFKKD